MTSDSTLTLPRHTALDILYCDHEAYEVAKDEITGTSRWSEHHDLVIERISDMTFWRASYSQGSTEYQDENPWDDVETVEFTQVFPKEVRITSYVTAAELEQ